MGIVLVVVGGIALIAIVSISIALFSSAVKTGQAESSQVKIGAPSQKKLDADTAKRLSEAHRKLTSIRLIADKIEDKEIRNQAQDLIDQTDTLFKSIKEHADANRIPQFFCYYVPTTETVLEKYVVLEKSGENIDKQKETVKGYLENMSQAFDAHYKSLFDDEKIDLEVEAEAMETTLKRDGLL